MYFMHKDESVGMATLDHTDEYQTHPRTGMIDTPYAVHGKPSTQPLACSFIESAIAANAACI